MKKKSLIIGIILLLVAMLFLLTGCGNNQEGTGDVKGDNKSNTSKQEEMLYPHRDSETKKWGYINKNGEYKIEPQFEHIWEFEKDLDIARVRINSNKVGVIDRSGNYVVEPQYYAIGEFSKKGYAIVETSESSSTGKAYGVINQKGEFVLELKNTWEIKSNSPNGLFYVNGKNSNDINGYYNESGEKVFTIEGIKRGGIFNKNGYAGVEVYEQYGAGNGKNYGIINDKGEWIRKPFAGEIMTVDDEEYLIFSENSKRGIIDINGNILIEPKYTSLVKAGDNLAFKESYEGKEGLMNIKGEIIMEPKYDYLTCFNDKGIGIARIGEKYGFVNEKGDIVAEAIYDRSMTAEVYQDGSFLICQDGKYGIMGNDGKVLVEPF